MSIMLVCYFISWWYDVLWILSCQLFVLYRISIRFLYDM